MRSSAGFTVTVRVEIRSASEQLQCLVCAAHTTPSRQCVGSSPTISSTHSGGPERVQHPRNVLPTADIGRRRFSRTPSTASTYGDARSCRHPHRATYFGWVIHTHARLHAHRVVVIRNSVIRPSGRPPTLLHVDAPSTPRCLRAALHVALWGVHPSTLGSSPLDTLRAYRPGSPEKKGGTQSEASIRTVSRRAHCRLLILVFRTIAWAAARSCQPPITSPHETIPSAFLNHI